MVVQSLYKQYRVSEGVNYGQCVSYGQRALKVLCGNDRRMLAERNHCVEGRSLPKISFDRPIIQTRPSPVFIMVSLGVIHHETSSLSVERRRHGPRCQAWSMWQSLRRDRTRTLDTMRPGCPLAGMTPPENFMCSDCTDED